jgi:hypothetical protein
MLWMFVLSNQRSIKFSGSRPCACITSLKLKLEGWGGLVHVSVELVYLDSVVHRDT